MGEASASSASAAPIAAAHGNANPNPPSPSVQATMNNSNAFQPKRQTFSRFFRRHPYNERRSRAVAPAEVMPPRMRTRRHAGGSELSLIREGSVSHLPQFHRVRLSVGEFMRKLYVEMFFVIIVLFYGAFVIIQLAVDDTSLEQYQHIIEVTDMTVGSILLIEITLKIFAYGFEYLRNGWSLFDAIVIITSFVLGIVAATGTTSNVLLKILRMRVVLRILRVIVVIERLKLRSRTMKFSHKHAITSPVEHVLRLLHDLRFHPALRASIRSDIEYAIDVIKNNRLYDANLHAEAVDDTTKQWLREEMLKADDANTALVESRPNGPVHVHDATVAVAAAPTNSEVMSMSQIRRGATMKELLPPLDASSEFELHSLLQGVSAWTFDIFRIQSVTNGNALCHLGYYLMHEYAGAALQIDQQTLIAFLLEIQQGYVATNPYHNSIHAADVVQTTSYFLIQPELATFLRPLDHVLAMIAAAIHDFKHDGFNNSFHISTASEIALRYNDHAVLENFHVAQSFLVMKNPDCNVLGRLSSEDFKYAREMIIQMVLATDMAKHFEDVALFKANILPSSGEPFVIKNVADKKLVLKMILHTCDVSNPSKPRETMLRWTDRVVEEFFVQGEMEKQLSLAVSPFMDRETIVLKKMQVGFADFIVAPLFSAWSEILPNINTTAYKTLMENREWWASQSEDYKPHMIKDTVRELTMVKRQTLCEVEQGAGLAPIGGMTPHVRRSVASMALSTEEII